jgi:exopolysaccharide production protein ExoZ
MKKILSIQAARGLAALMVVGFHAQSIDHKYLTEPFLPHFFNIGQTGVDLFFVVSGFVMAITTRQRRGLADSRRFLANRFFRIYPTYWLYFCALAVVYFTMPGLINSSQGGKVDLVRSFFLLPSDSLPLLMVAWSLTLELWFYIVFALLILAPRRAVSSVLLVWLAGILACAVLLDTPNNLFLRVLVHPFTVEFIFGALAGLLWLSPRSANVGGRAGASLAVAGTAIVVMTYKLGVIDGSDVIATASTLRVVTVGIGYAALLLGLAFMERAGRQILKPLGSIGDASYTLYLSHILTLNLCARIWFASPLANRDSAMNMVAFWALTLLACLAFTWVAYRMTERPLVLFFNSRIHSQAQDVLGDSQGAKTMLPPVTASR